MFGQNEAVAIKRVLLRFARRYSNGDPYFCIVPRLVLGRWPGKRSGMQSIILSRQRLKSSPFGVEN